MKPLVGLPLLAALSLPFSPQDPKGPQPSGPVVVSLSFHGGTLAEFVGQIRSGEPRVNIIVAESAKDARLPPIELRSAGLDAVLDAACVVAEGSQQIEVHDFHGDGGEPVYSIVAVQSGDQEGQIRPQQTTQVHALSHLMAGGPNVGFQDAVILSSLEAAMEGTAGKPIVRLHKESGLLIFRGTQEQLDILATVMESLDQEVRRRGEERARREANGELLDTPIERAKR